MKVIVNTSAIERNIAKAQKLVNVPVSLMFKDFYEDIFYHVNTSSAKEIFGLNLNNSVCYSINKANGNNNGAIVVYKEDADRCYNLGIRKFYIPIDAGDEREGLSVCEAIQFARTIPGDCEVHGLITSGCINDCAPSNEELYDIYDSIRCIIKSISLGGSYYLSKGFLPEFISDIRIGEYMLFGTIPYDNCDYRLGDNSIILCTKVIESVLDNRFLVDCGYSMADIKDCVLLGSDNNIRFIDSSSEYTILSECFGNQKNVGEEVDFRINYKSLVKLRNAEIEYIR